jgi:hypothetical protein
MPPKEHRQVETRAIQLGQYRLLYKLIDQTKEKDGIKLPLMIRQIDCHPAAPLNLLVENIEIHKQRGGFSTILNELSL